MLFALLLKKAMIHSSDCIDWSSHDVLMLAGDKVLYYMYVPYIPRAYVPVQMNFTWSLTDVVYTQADRPTTQGQGVKGGESGDLRLGSSGFKVWRGYVLVGPSALCRTVPEGADVSKIQPKSAIMTMTERGLSRKSSSASL